MGMFDSFFHPEKGYKNAQNDLNNYYGQSQGYLQPYNQNGQNAFGALTGAQDALLNPEGLHDRFSNAYTESDAAKNAERMATEHGQNAAATMGLGGSSAALQAIHAGTNDIAAQDKQKYMDDMMQKYIQGAGIAQGIYGQGANAATNMSNNANNMGQNSANMTYGQTNSPGSTFGGLVGLGGTILGSALGGPIGGAIGGGLSSLWNTGGGK